MLNTKWYLLLWRGSDSAVWWALVGFILTRYRDSDNDSGSPPPPFNTKLKITSASCSAQPANPLVLLSKRKSLFFLTVRCLSKLLGLNFSCSRNPGRGYAADAIQMNFVEVKRQRLCMGFFNNLSQQHISCWRRKIEFGTVPHLI